LDLIYKKKDRDEWVILLQGKAVLSYVDGSRLKLDVGDYSNSKFKN
jgi:hypothetical protein